MGPAVALTPPVRGPRVRHGCPRPQPRYPAGLIGRRPRPPLPTAVVQTPGSGPPVGRGTKREQRGAVSVSTGLVPKHHPKVHPTPAGPRPRGGNVRRPAPPVSRA